MILEESIYDMIISQLHEYRREVRDVLREDFKRTKPFRQEPVSPKEQLVEYDELTPEKKQWLLQEFGQEAVLPYFESMEKIKSRYTGKGE